MAEQKPVMVLGVSRLGETTLAVTEDARDPERDVEQQREMLDVALNTPANHNSALLAPATPNIELGDLMSNDAGKLEYIESGIQQGIDVWVYFQNDQGVYLIGQVGTVSSNDSEPEITVFCPDLGTRPISVPPSQVKGISLVELKPLNFGVEGIPKDLRVQPAETLFYVEPNQRLAAIIEAIERNGIERVWIYFRSSNGHYRVGQAIANMADNKIMVQCPEGVELTTIKTIDESIQIHGFTVVRGPTVTASRPPKLRV